MEEDDEGCTTCKYRSVDETGKEVCLAAQERMNMDKFILEANRLYAVWYKDGVTKDNISDLAERAAALTLRLQRLSEMWKQCNEHGKLLVSPFRWCEHYKKVEDESKV